MKYSYSAATSGAKSNVTSIWTCSPSIAGKISIFAVWSSSLSRIVIVLVETGIEALTGLDNLKVINSSFSLKLSSIKSKTIVLFVSPGLNVSVPELAT